MQDILAAPYRFLSMLIRETGQGTPPLKHLLQRAFGLDHGAAPAPSATKRRPQRSASHNPARPHLRAITAIAKLSIRLPVADASSCERPLGPARSLAGSIEQSA
ncbi:hypothetical protein, partial [Mesorhizobium sp. M7A.F.Ca.US.006.04.2.1]|uniref:hypothetical protein n=1 Tax=Mesorhizobium sp. M7A.F.Ca.US.006.04.2.1 TaxID=2496696 RepID=UPI0032AE9B0B